MLWQTGENRLPVPLALLLDTGTMLYAHANLWYHLLICCCLLTCSDAIHRNEYVHGLRFVWFVLVRWRPISHIAFGNTSLALAMEHPNEYKGVNGMSLRRTFNTSMPEFEPRGLRDSVSNILNARSFSTNSGYIHICCLILIVYWYRGVISNREETSILPLGCCIL